MKNILYTLSVALMVFAVSCNGTKTNAPEKEQTPKDTVTKTDNDVVDQTVPVNNEVKEEEPVYTELDNEDQLPDGVMAFYGTNYPFSEITSMTRVDYPDGSTIYEVKVKLNEVDEEEAEESGVEGPYIYDLKFDSEGNLLDQQRL